MIEEKDMYYDQSQQPEVNSLCLTPGTGGEDMPANLSSEILIKEQYSPVTKASANLMTEAQAELLSTEQ